MLTPKKAIYTGKTDLMCLTQGKEYEIISIEDGWYRVIDDEGVYECDEIPGYLYPPELFKIIEWKWM